MLLSFFGTKTIKKKMHAKCLKADTKKFRVFLSLLRKKKKNAWKLPTMGKRKDIS